jgi:hypothetical protein
MNILKFFGLYTCLLLTIGCGSETQDVVPTPSKRSYFPLTLGNEFTYQSDSIYIGNGGAIRDTFSGQILEIVKDTFRSADNELLYLLERFFRRIDDDQWSRTNSWVAGINDDYAFRTEENLKFVKLVFPPVLGAKWDANRFFNENQKIQVGNEILVIYQSWRSSVESIEEKFSFNDQEYPAIQVSVVDINNSTVLQRKVNEWYADGLGLVRKEMTILDGETLSGSGWTPKKGFIHSLRLIDFKK